MSFKKTLVKQNSLILANKNISLTKYVDSVRKKHDEDEDCAKWDTSLPLPKLPVPELEMSLKKYLRCIMPIISEDAYAKTESIVKDFSNPGGIGEKLQQILLKTAEEKDNWAYDWWLEDMYMMNKLALPINSNPGMIFPTENFINEDAQLKFVARLISGIMDYKLIIDAGSLPIDRCTCREKGQPLCMEQYYRLFSSYRLPGIEKDKLIDSSELCNCLEDEQAEHIIVISLNQIFVLDVVFNLVRLTEEQVYQQLKRIKRQSEEDLNTSNAHADVGFLTSLPRDKWAQARCELIKEPVNQECLDLIERCIFVICLDKKVKNSSRHRENSNSINETLEYVSLSDENKENQLQENNIEQDISKSMTPIAFQMLHGCNSKNNSGNRWFDKTMQFIISEDGLCGLNYEHSPSEGIAVIELSEHLFRYM